MKILQWTYRVSEDKQEEFIEYSRSILGPTWKKFGCKKYKLYKVADKKVVGRQIVEENMFIEWLYFDDDFDLNKFFAAVRTDKKAHQISRSYEEKFDAADIKLRVMGSVAS